MPDSMSKAARSRTMSSVRTRDTTPELALRRGLSIAGVRGYRLHRRDVLGCPDLCWLGQKVAVFVDGGFWHGHPRAFKPGRSGDFWDNKIARNVARDSFVTAGLTSAGWSVVRIWDFEIAEDLQRCVSVVGSAIETNDR